jgi:hypothetical protein
MANRAAGVQDRYGVLAPRPPVTSRDEADRTASHSRGSLRIGWTRAAHLVAKIA